MFYLVGHLWLYQVLTLVLGIIFGWWAAGSNRLVHKPLLWAAAAILVAGGLFAYFQAARGQPGLWWDIWMLLFLAYVAGCLIAFLLRAVTATNAKTAPAPAIAVQTSAAPAVAVSLAEKVATPSMAPARHEAAVTASATVAMPSRSPSSSAAAIGPFPTAPVLFRSPGAHVSDASDASQAEVAKAPAPAAASVAPMPQSAPAPAMTPVALTSTGDDADHFDDADETIIAARPPGLAAPDAGKKDDLKRISGIGRVNERKLNELGIFHFSQIAAWSSEHAKWVNSHLAFPGRIQREKWISQAKLLATGADTEFSSRVKAGKVPTSS